MTVEDSFPRQYARTQRLTLGEPRTFTVAPDGRTVLFLRSAAGDDAVNMLWSLDVESGEERLLVDPRSLPIAGADSAEEARRRERAREGATGIVGYSVDANFTTVVTVLGGRLLTVDIGVGTCTDIPVPPGIFDARPNRDASLVAYIRGGSLWVCDRAGNEHLVAGDDDGDVTWGVADFAAAEEMGRMRGYWWSPAGDSIAACRVDNRNVRRWHIADPSRPEAPAAEHRYPAAGTDNAEVTLHVLRNVGEANGTDRTEIDLGSGWEYLNAVSWSSAGLIAQTQTRDQRRVTVVRIDPSTGTSSVLWEDHDETWVELTPGTPSLTADGALVTCADRDGVRRLLVDGTAVTPADMQVRSVAAVGRSILFAANPLDSPRRLHLWRHDTADGSLVRVTDGEIVSSGAADGDGHTTVVRVTDMTAPRARFSVLRHGSTDASNAGHISSHAEEPLVDPNVTFHEVGARRTQVAVVMPRDGDDRSLPVLFNPYGGPHAQMVVDARNAYATSQWFADRGFCVVVADNRGTPGRGTAYERSVHLDLATPVLEDQVEVALALPSIAPRADIGRVAIRGWSFGGYLAALAVLRAPETFHCAVAGAPVTEWRLYDTHYTERYLGDPRRDPAPYDVSGLLGDAHGLRRPLLVIHGLADDNVVAAHTLRLSTALLGAGRPHEVLPLSGVTHMTPDEVVAENLLLHQLEFIRRSLGVDGPR